MFGRLNKAETTILACSFSILCELVFLELIPTDSEIFAKIMCQCIAIHNALIFVSIMRNLVPSRFMQLFNNVFGTHQHVLMRRGAG